MADNRRIVGVLVSYSWRPEGQLYPVRQGRNYIGAHNHEDRTLEVHIPEDVCMSQSHAVIMVQSGEFYIGALFTEIYVNDKKLDPDAIEKLPSGAEIKIAQTVLRFVPFD